MELTIRVADPAGNITIFVKDRIKPELYVPVAEKLIKETAFKAEQVGFVVPPVLGGRNRLEMMGGEFCGNALRSFGYLQSLLEADSPDEVLVEISGSDQILAVNIDQKRGLSETQMPLPKRVEPLATALQEYFSMVVFDGVCHVIVPGPAGNAELVKRILEAAKKRVHCDAYGIMFLEEERMTPVVYVSATQSIIWEGSCGSGSVACAVYLAQKEEQGTFSYTFHQPRGTIQASVIMEQKKVAACRMGGPVSISDEIKVNIEFLD